MKILLLFVFLIGLPIISFADGTEEIILEITAKHSIDIGYALTYQCEVHKVIKGEIKDSVLSLTILPSQNKNWENLLEQNPSPVHLIITFIKNKDNEPYSHSYINGFVDRNKTSWKITDIKIKEE